jgi:hypothetical protein
MALDIRLPIGMMFLLLGPILFGCGIVNHDALSQHTGEAMIAFGLPMFLFGRAAQRASRRAA